MRTYQLVVAFACASALATSGAAAQETAIRQGFWINFGFGGGASVNDDVTTETSGGFAAYVRLGAVVTPNILLGGEFIGWSTGGDDSGVARANLTFDILFYPKSDGGFFLKGGIGGASATKDVTGITTTRGGPGTTLGIGYDLPVGGVSVTPNLDWMFQRIDTSVGTSYANLFLLTVGVGWY